MNMLSTIKSIVYFILLFPFIISCTKDLVDDKKGIPIDKGEPVIERKFALYDAMNYPGKPDLTNEGVLPVYLIYENALTTSGTAGANDVVLDMDKVEVMAELASQFPYVMVSTDIEDWFGDAKVDQDIMFDRFNIMFDVFRSKSSSIQIGNYGIAPSALCVYRFYNKDRWEEDVLIQNWKSSNAKRWKSIDAADVIMPVVYIAEPNIESWIKDLDITITEIKKYNTNKKIIVYIWPQYYNKPDSPYNSEIIDAETWMKMLEAVYEKCDGAIIWSGRTDKNGSTIHWNDAKIQAIWSNTKAFVSNHKNNLQSPIVEPSLTETYDPNKRFKIFGSFSYSNKPLLYAEGIHDIVLIQEKDLSSGILTNNIYEPQINKVTALAAKYKSNNQIPICIIGGTWIRDRTTNQQAMISRYREVRNVFKSTNDESALGYIFVGATSLSGLRITNGNFYVNTAGWMQSAVIPTRPLRSFADYLLPAAYIVDDDVNLWKKELYLAIKEARNNNPNKPIYAYIYTDYFNQNINFVNSYQPISEATYFEMLEAIFKICDGVVMSNLTNSVWKDNFGFFTATRKFVEKYRGNIDFPTIPEPSVTPEPSEEWFVEGNIIQNGSFETELSAYATSESVYGSVFPALLNLQGFFDLKSRTTSPMAPETTITDYVWFERGTTQSQCRIYVNNTYAHSGDKSIVLHNIGGNTNNATATSWVYHNLAQRIALNDSKRYKLTFYVKRDLKYRTNDNLINKLQVGIISSTNALPTHNSTFSQEVVLEQNENWQKISVVFNLPTIIASNVGKSLSSSAVFIAMQTSWDSVNSKTLESILHIDDISLVEN